MIKKSLILVTLFLIGVTNSYAQNVTQTVNSLSGTSGAVTNGRSDSSSLVPNPNSTIPYITKPSNTAVSAGFTSIQSTKYTYAACPAGFSYNGSNQYPTTQQTITTYYRNGLVVGTSSGPVTDVAADCSKTETQTVACPAGQTGNITQSRLVSTGDPSYEYGAWSTTSDTCVSPPAPTVTTQTETLSCPTGQTGEIDQYRTVTTANDGTGTVTYGPWTITNNTCTVAVNPGNPTDTCTTKTGAVSCASYAGQYGIPAADTVGTASYSYQMCSVSGGPKNITYTGGCSAPVAGCVWWLPPSSSNTVDQYGHTSSYKQWETIGLGTYPPGTTMTMYDESSTPIYFGFGPFGASYMGQGYSCVIQTSKCDAASGQFLITNTQYIPASGTQSTPCL